MYVCICVASATDGLYRFKDSVCHTYEVTAGDPVRTSDSHKRCVAAAAFLTAATVAVAQMAFRHAIAESSLNVTFCSVPVEFPSIHYNLPASILFRFYTRKSCRRK